MPVDMGPEGARRVSAPVTVRSANTPLEQQRLVQHRLTALRATLADMEQEAAGQASAPGCACTADTRRPLHLQGRRQPTVFYALQVDTVQEAALRVSALVIVPLVGTPQAQLAQVQRRLIALHATWVLSLTLWAARANRAALHVPLGGMLI